MITDNDNNYAGSMRDIFRMRDIQERHQLRIQIATTIFAHASARAERPTDERLVTQSIDLADALLDALAARLEQELKGA